MKEVTFAWHALTTAAVAIYGQSTGFPIHTGTHLIQTVIHPTLKVNYAYYSAVCTQLDQVEGIMGLRVAWNPGWPEGFFERD